MYTGQQYSQHYYGDQRKIRGLPMSFHIAGAIPHYLDAVKTLTNGTHLYLEKDKCNIHDPHAIKITTVDGEQCGFVPKSKIEEVSKHSTDYFLTVSNITEHYIVVELNDTYSKYYG